MSRVLLTRRAAGTEAGSGKKISAVVDDSDFDLGGTPPSADPDKEFDKLMKAADSFGSKMDRKRKKRPSADDDDLALVSDTRGGISLDSTIEDDVFDTKELMATARSGRVDTSVQGRITKWAGETQELIQNPTSIQITYATIFLSSVAILFLVGLLTFVVGGVRFRGDSLEVYKRRQRDLQDPIHTCRGSPSCRRTCAGERPWTTSGT
ncbi:unnamed protein product [Prorocentrum cordatum]|uniref:Uncharacterized protein n=1 Tax=Prorocentrum cordatum TaxID=2364126 RepID=A0ABN9SPX3_9DINO|nr:unnamed protein product [Polarella glacialis]